MAKALKGGMQCFIKWSLPFQQNCAQSSEIIRYPDILGRHYSLRTKASEITPMSSQFLRLQEQNRSNNIQVTCYHFQGQKDKFPTALYYTMLDGNDYLRCDFFLIIIVKVSNSHSGFHRQGALGSSYKRGTQSLGMVGSLFLKSEQQT